MTTSAQDLSQLSIEQIIAQHPQTEAVFKQFGLLTYATTETAKRENLEASALVHNVDITKLLAELTKAL